MVTDVDRTALFEDPTLKNYINDTFIATVHLRLANMFGLAVNQADKAKLETAADTVSRLCKNLVKDSIINAETHQD